MKSLNFLIRSLGIGVLVLLILSYNTTDLGASVNTDFSELVQKVDLKVSAIATPGGLCKGKNAKVRVSITNSQRVGVKEDIPVILYVKQNGYTASYVGKLKGGIGPGANTGQPVWFNEVQIDNVSSVEFRAVVNPDLEIPETVYNNNTKVVRVRTKSCGQTGTQQGKTLTVTVFKWGTWSAGHGDGISGAAVVVVKNGQTYSGTTNSQGKAVISSVPKGTYRISVTKSGYQQVKDNLNGTNPPHYPATYKTFSMPTYDTNTNIPMAPN